MDIPCGQWVTVILKSSLTRQGYFYTVDPDTNSMILYDQETNKAIVILGHSVLNYEVDDNKCLSVEEIERALHCHQDHVPTEEQLKARKNKLIHYFEKHRIPITHSTDDPVIQVLGCARVRPPYVSTSITSDNVILRKRVRDLILQYDQQVTKVTTTTAATTLSPSSLSSSS